MRAHIVLAHPERQSANGQLAETSRAHLSSRGDRATLSDLYAMDFDPREGAHHFARRADDTFFHAQTEQRHSADNDAIAPEIADEI